MDVRFARYAEYQQRRVEAGAATVREVGIVAILRAKRDMDVRQALADLRAYMPGM